MNHSQTDHITTVWLEMVHSHEELLRGVGVFLSSDKKEREKALICNYSGNRPLTVLLLRDYVPVEDLKALLPFLLSNAESVHQYLFAFRTIILRIPREWLMAHIEEAAQSILKDGDDETYPRLIELYIQIDRSLAIRLANQAIASVDAETRAVGSEFLEIL